jgi:hypothetical protein
MAFNHKQEQDLIDLLHARFDKHTPRHSGITWAAVQARLEAHPHKLDALQQMQTTGGEPDVVGLDASTGEILFFDCSPESPAGRRSLCYDRDAWEMRKSARPANTALDVAAAMGVELLTEDEYQALQRLGNFDTKTSSWLLTPPEVRALNGAIFGDRRFGRVFIYHNGAESYYAARGFRASLRV